MQILFPEITLQENTINSKNNNNRNIFIMFDFPNYFCPK